MNFLLTGLFLSLSSNVMLDPIAYRLDDKSEKISAVDTITDASIQKFLDNSHFFGDYEYEPIDLEPINSDFTSNNARLYSLRGEAAEKFADMARHFWNSFGGKKKLSITTAYRSYQYQIRLLQGYCKNKAHQCAQAGASEHQAGLALDLGTNGGSLDAASFSWLKNNAHKRGFHNTYQKGVEIDGQKIEPWHWRYLGEALATELYEKEMSFAEWYYSLEKNG